MGAGSTASGFVGRSEEIAKLLALLGQVRSGRPAAVLIGGEAGIGKTCLIREIAGQAEASGMRALYGSCVDVSGGGLPYGAVVELLNDVVDNLGPRRFAELSGITPREALRWLAVGDRETGLGHGGAQLELFEQIRGLLSRVAAERPLLVIVEDLHWADCSTLDLLGFVLRRQRHAPVLVIATYRSDELPHRTDLRALLSELDRGRFAERFELAPFSRAEIARLAECVLQRPVATDATARVHARSGGNPFFAVELVKKDAAGDVLPQSIKEAVLTRAVTLSAEAQETLRLVAVARSTVEHQVLAAASDLTERGLIQALREPVECRLLIAGRSGYAFAHALTREAIYGDLLPGERLRLHRRIAAALEIAGSRAGPAGIAEIAHHWAEAQERPRALRASVAAGQAALAVHAAAEAYRQLVRALDFWDEADDPVAMAGVEHDELCRQAAEAARWSGKPSAAIELIQAGLSRLDAAAAPVRAAILHERRGQYLWVAGDSSASLAAYETAAHLLASWPPLPATARVYAQQGSALMLAGHYLASRGLCEKAIEIARSVHAPAEEGHARNTLGVDLAMTGQSEAGLAELRAARAIADETGRLEDRYRAFANLTFVLDNIGRLTEGLEQARHGIEIMRRHDPGAAGSGVLTANLVSLLIRTGNWEQAASRIEEALAQAPYSGLACLFHLLLGELETGRGRLDRAVASFADASRCAAGSHDPQLMAPLHAGLASIALWRAQPGEAWVQAELALESLTGAEEHQMDARLCALGLRVSAERAAAARSRNARESIEQVYADADELLGRAHETAASSTVPGNDQGSVLPEIAVHTLLSEAEFDRLHARPGPDRWAEVAAGWDGLQCPYPAAYARWRQTEALAGQGKRPAAAQVLGDALRVTSSLGATLLQAELEALGRRARLAVPGGPPPTRPARRPEDKFGLTAREREVLAELADGATNRRIARALFITEKTASVHVSNIMAKLGAANRGEAAALARRLGLMPDGPREEVSSK